MAKELKGKGGFWDIPILGQIANVLYTAGSDVLGVTGQAAEDVAKTTARAGIDVADTASGGLLQESLEGGLGADKAQLASILGFGLNPNKMGKGWKFLNKLWGSKGKISAGLMANEMQNQFRVIPELTGLNIDTGIFTDMPISEQELRLYPDQFGLRDISMDDFGAWNKPSEYQQQMIDENKFAQGLLNEAKEDLIEKNVITPEDWEQNIFTPDTTKNNSQFEF